MAVPTSNIHDPSVQGPKTTTVSFCVSSFIFLREGIRCLDSFSQAKYRKLCVSGQWVDGLSWVWSRMARPQRSRGCWGGRMSEKWSRTSQSPWYLPREVGIHRLSATSPQGLCKSSLAWRLSEESSFVLISNFREILRLVLVTFFFSPHSYFSRLC